MQAPSHCNQTLHTVGGLNGHQFQLHAHGIGHVLGQVGLHADQEFAVGHDLVSNLVGAFGGPHSAGA